MSVGRRRLSVFFMPALQANALKAVKRIGSRQQQRWLRLGAEQSGDKTRLRRFTHSHPSKRLVQPCELPFDGGINVHDFIQEFVNLRFIRFVRIEHFQRIEQKKRRVMLRSVQEGDGIVDERLRVWQFDAPEECKQARNSDLAVSNQVKALSRPALGGRDRFRGARQEQLEGEGHGVARSGNVAHRWRSFGTASTPWFDVAKEQITEFRHSVQSEKPGGE